MKEGSGSLADTQRDPGVLHAAVGVQKFCSDCSHAWPNRVRHHFFQPRWRNHIDIVVKESDHFSSGRPHGLIDHRGEVEGTRMPHDPHTLILRKIRKEPTRLRVLAVVVDYD